jgi:hypothetical protein
MQYFFSRNELLQQAEWRQMTESDICKNPMDAETLTEWQTDRQIDKSTGPTTHLYLVTTQKINGDLCPCPLYISRSQCLLTGQLYNNSTSLQLSLWTWKVDGMYHRVAYHTIQKVSVVNKPIHLLL